MLEFPFSPSFSLIRPDDDRKRIRDHSVILIVYDFSAISKLNGAGGEGDVICV